MTAATFLTFFLANIGLLFTLFSIRKWIAKGAAERKDMEETFSCVLFIFILLNVLLVAYIVFQSIRGAI